VSLDLPTPAVALAIGAHPDDVEFQAGATLAKWAAQGCVVHHLILTDGSKGTWNPDEDIPALVQARIIECEITIATAAGRHTGIYRLATTLLDSRQHPAFELVKLYHERWEIESAYFALKKTMLGRRVLRSRTMPGIAQEIYALLTAYQVIRIAISDATAAIPGTDPDRASFSIALQAARDQIIQAANVLAGTVIDLAGVIGRAVLDHPMPTRRLRVSPRAVKRPLSRYAYKSLRVDRRTYKATISIDILTALPNP